MPEHSGPNCRQNHERPTLAKQIVYVVLCVLGDRRTKVRVEHPTVTRVSVRSSRDGNPSPRSLNTEFDRGSPRASYKTKRKRTLGPWDTGEVYTKVVGPWTHNTVLRLVYCDNCYHP